MHDAAILSANIQDTSLKVEQNTALKVSTRINHISSALKKDTTKVRCNRSLRTTLINEYDGCVYKCILIGN